MTDLMLRPDRKRILFICGSMNQTTQMHQIARELPEYEHWFSPYYTQGLLERFRKRGGLDFTIPGGRFANRAFYSLTREGLNVDYQGKQGPYDLVLTCAD